MGEEIKSGKAAKNFVVPTSESFHKQVNSKVEKLNTSVAQVGRDLFQKWMKEVGEDFEDPKEAKIKELEAMIDELQNWKRGAIEANAKWSAVSDFVMKEAQTPSSVFIIGTNIPDSVLSFLKKQSGLGNLYKDNL